MQKQIRKRINISVQIAALEATSVRKKEPKGGKRESPPIPGQFINCYKWSSCILSIHFLMFILPLLAEKQEQSITCCFPEGPRLNKDRVDLRVDFVTLTWTPSPPARPASPIRGMWTLQAGEPTGRCIDLASSNKDSTWRRNEMALLIRERGLWQWFGSSSYQAMAHRGGRSIWPESGMVNEKTARRLQQSVQACQMS